jgi:hypothetical protein
MTDGAEANVVDRRGPRIFHRAIALTLAIEAFTIVMRYGFEMQSTRDTASTIGVLTFGLRIHHGYVGVVMILSALVTAARWPRLRPHLLVWGAALVCSDLIHHFLVLWPIEGSPEFHIWYGEATER